MQGEVGRFPRKMGIRCGAQAVCGTHTCLPKGGVPPLLDTLCGWAGAFRRSPASLPNEDGSLRAPGLRLPWPTLRGLDTRQRFAVGSRFRIVQRIALSLREQETALSQSIKAERKKLRHAGFP
jgi:hypothetical protein